MKESLYEYFTTSEGLKSGKWQAYSILALRLMMGWIFFTSGLGKMFDKNGIAFKYASVYLSNATPIVTPHIAFSIPEILGVPGLLVVKAGTLFVEPLMNILAGLSFIGPLVVVSEIAVGIALLLGVLTRLSAIGGAFMMLLYYYGSAAWKQGLINGDLAYMAIFLTVATFNAGRIYGLDEYISEKIETENRYLEFLLGG